MDKSYLVFGHRGAHYALDARAVREIVWLPELSPIEELPAHIVGVFNLRGKVLPLMDLGLRFGHAREEFRLSDRVVVIETEAARVGIVVNELYDVVAIPQAAIEGVAGYQSLGAIAHFVCGEAKVGESIVMLLDETALAQSAPPEDLVALAGSGAAQVGPAAACAPPAAADARVFRERAHDLARETRAEERAGLTTYGVIDLGGELFGFPIDVVREFAHVNSVSPVPCCPAHIVGSMNLRGDILTLADIRPALGMPTEGTMSEVVVLRLGELLLGVPAAEIVDVVILGQADIAEVPVASDGGHKAYCKGIATVNGRAISILDLEKILAGRELQVAEQVQ